MRDDVHAVSQTKDGTNEKLSSLQEQLKLVTQDVSRIRILEQQVLISILIKNQAAPIEMVINDFFRIPKTFIAFVSLCYKSPKSIGKL